MSSSESPRLQLDSLVGQTTPRSDTSRLPSYLEHQSPLLPVADRVVEQKIIRLADRTGLAAFNMAGLHSDLANSNASPPVAAKAALALDCGLWSGAASTWLPPAFSQKRDPVRDNEARQRVRAWLGAVCESASPQSSSRALPLTPKKNTERFSSAAAWIYEARNGGKASDRSARREVASLFDLSLRHPAAASTEEAAQQERSERERRAQYETLQRGMTEQPAQLAAGDASTDRGGELSDQEERACRSERGWQEERLSRVIKGYQEREKAFEGERNADREELQKARQWCLEIRAQQERTREQEKQREEKDMERDVMRQKQRDAELQLSQRREEMIVQLKKELNEYRMKDSKIALEKAVSDSEKALNSEKQKTKEQEMIARLRQELSDLQAAVSNLKLENYELRISHSQSLVSLTEARGELAQSKVKQTSMQEEIAVLEKQLEEHNKERIRDREDLQRETFEKWRLLEELRGIRESLRATANEEAVKAGEMEDGGSKYSFLSLLGDLPASELLSPRWEVVNRDDTKNRRLGGAAEAARRHRQGGRGTVAKKEDVLSEGSRAAVVDRSQENSLHKAQNGLSIEKDAFVDDAEQLTSLGKAAEHSGMQSPSDVKRAAGGVERVTVTAKAGTSSPVVVKPVVLVKKEVEAGNARLGGGVAFFGDETFAELLEETQNLRTMLGIGHDDVHEEKEVSGGLGGAASGSSVQLTSLRLTI